METIDLLAEYLPMLMDQYKQSINRQTGMGLKIFKFHCFLHFVDDLRRNIVPQNTSSGPGESRHKIACKQPAKNTLRIAC